MKYDKEYFIKKFEAIPEQEIGAGSIKSHCALWHCGCEGEHDYERTGESDALIILLGGDPTSEIFGLSWATVTRINDGHREHKSLGFTPKQRILNQLKSL